MRTIRDIKIFENIPVLVRTVMNVPVKNGCVMNEHRLRSAIPTINFLTDRGARVILISHIGDKGTETLEPVAKSLGKLIRNVSFFGETVGERTRAKVRDLSPGHILVLENLRRNRGEKMNDEEFARELAMLADLFVQDSFDTCHRAHASIIGVPKFLPSYAGMLLEEEIQELSRALAPKHPALAVIGGVKFGTKEPVISALLKKYDHVFVGGALANDFLKASGQEIGKSLVSIADPANIKKLLVNKKLLLPIDSVMKDGHILDHGPKTTALLNNLVKKMKTILWNGPLGNYESGFVTATDALAYAVASSKAYSVVGGGDTVASIEHLGLLPQFSFVSTGGGAMLDFLAHGTLLGIAALDKS